MAQNKAKFSERGSALIRVDVAALSPVARRQTNMKITLPAVTQNVTTVNAESEVVPFACKITAAYVSFRTIPACAGGTSTISLKTIAADGSTKVVATGPDTILAKTNDVPFALTLAVTNPTNIPVGSSFEVAIVTSNNAVGTQQVGGQIKIVVEKIEDPSILD